MFQLQKWDALITCTYKAMPGSIVEDVVYLTPKTWWKKDTLYITNQQTGPAVV
jgi:hypothetical protein